jgi:arsenical pump membrane protein
MVSQALVAVIALITVTAVLTRPRGISEGTVAISGAVLMVATGQIPLDVVGDTLRGLIPVIAFLLGLFWLTLACERAGLFDLAALATLKSAHGNSYTLLVAVFLLGTLTTAILSNDATVVLVTPVVLRICRQIGLPPLPYLFACTFVADTASSLLPVSNPINLLYAERLGFGFLEHVSYLAAPTLAAILVNWVVFHFLFRSQIPGRFDTNAHSISSRRRDYRDHLIVAGLIIVAAGYVVSAFAGIGPYWITLCGGSALALVGIVSGRILPSDLIRVQPPALYTFVVGLAIVVGAAGHAGLLDMLGRGILHASDAGVFGGLVAVTFGTAFGTNVVNNWTMALATIPALEQAGATNLLVAGSIMGADIGPNLSVVGSLATLIWLTEVRREQIAVSARTYLKLGIVATLPAIGAATCVLYMLHLIRQ